MIIQNRFKIKLPNTLEIIIYLFIFAAEILGKINNFYIIIPYWDTILHTLNGFLAAAIGFSLVYLLNSNSEKIHLSPIYVCIAAFCFSMTIGVCWEFFEYFSDKYLKFDMQKDTIVTDISTVTLNPLNENDTVLVEDIGKTIIYDNDGNVLNVINGGYLDIGLHDTMNDLFVNFIGAFVFCFFGYFYLINNKKNEFIRNFVPTKNNVQ